MKGNLKVTQVTKNGEPQPLVTRKTGKDGREYDIFKAYLVGKVADGIKQTDWKGIVTRFGKPGDFDHISVGTMLPIENIGQLTSSSPFYEGQEDLNGVYYQRGVQFCGEEAKAMFSEEQRKHAEVNPIHPAPVSVTA